MHPFFFYTLILLVLSRGYATSSDPLSAFSAACHKGTKHSPIKPVVPTGMSPSVEEIMSRMPAVHATNILPFDGWIKVGDTEPGKSEATDLQQGARATIHFALGELVRPHSANSWENYKYAVVTPLSELSGQLVNVNTYDSFIVGPHHLTNAAVLLVPESEVQKVPKGVRYYAYSPKVGLRSAIENVIGQNHWWSVKMQPNIAANGPAYIEEMEVNSPAFFKKLLAKYPYISFGGHATPGLGPAYLLGYLDPILNYATVMRGAESDRSLKFHIELSKFYLHKLESEYAKLDLPEQIRQGIMEMKKRHEQWISVINIELQAREKLGVTTGVLEGDFKKKLFQLRGNEEEMMNYLRGILDSQSRQSKKTTYEYPDDKLEEIDFLKKHKMLHDLSAKDIGAFLSGCDEKDAENFIAQHQDLFVGLDLKEVKEMYKQHRLKLMEKYVVRRQEVESVPQ